MPPRFSKNSELSEATRALLGDDADDFDDDEDDSYARGRSSRPDRGPAGGPRQPDPHLQRARENVQEVVAVMQSNLAKVLTRDDNLNHLEDKSEQLMDGARQFQASSRHLARKLWWQKMKMRLYVGIVILVIIVVIILVARYGKR